MLNGFTHALRLKADPARVVVRPFHLAWQAQGAHEGRAQQLVEDILALSERATKRILKDVFHDFEARHWQTKKVFHKRFDQIATLLKLDVDKISNVTRTLIGAYFCHEYSYAAAALMNPSVVPHPDQSGLDKHTTRIVLSLRAVGEGHISSIAFREGLISARGRLTLAPEPPFATAAETALDCDGLFTDGLMEVHRNEDSNLSGTVIFPVTPAQSNGLEDLRMTLFTHDDGRTEYLGTYTAFSGRGIQSEMMRTCDFRSFELVPLKGSAAVNKGMALFPRRIDGKYAMIARQDNENLYLIYSDDLHQWDGGQAILKPQFPWEFVQIGNCGSPIELDEGWLLLTHGVGPVRKYSIGAALLDKKDPSRVLARSVEPLLHPEPSEREGYVPNVVYTCGAMRHNDQIILPYAISDSYSNFATIKIAALMQAMS